MRLARNSVSVGALRRVLPAAVVSVAAVALGGCESNSFINPGEPNILPQGSAPLVKPILDTLDPAVEEADSRFTIATDVRPEDMQAMEGDYRIGKNDLVSVSIYDLLGEGTGETVKGVRVSESGTISLPFIRPVKAENLTEQELEDTIKKAYADAGQIRNARVSVTVAEARARTFSIQGNVGAAGQYQILTSDFRMLDALLQGRAPAQPGVEFAYVIRKPTKPSARAAPPGGTGGTGAPGTPPPPTTELLEPPQSQADPSGSPAQIHLLETRGANPASGPASRAGADLLAPDAGEPSSGVVEGQPVPIRTRDISPTTRGGDASVGSPNGFGGFKFDAPPSPLEQRIIKVPIDALRNGDLRYNIVIRPGDMIIVPEPVSGEYYMSGHVQRSGVYSLTGRKITIKMALASAGGFDQDAIPGRTEIIRRVGPNKEVFVRLDLDKVWSGEQPDLYLKPNDIVQVGTNAIAPFIAAVRNSFRFTYGFGFLYDRNFAPTNGRGF